MAQAGVHSCWHSPDGEPGSCCLPAPRQQTYHAAEAMLGTQAKPLLRLVLLYPPSLPEDSEFLRPASDVPHVGCTWQVSV